MDEQEHPTGAEALGPSVSGVTPPVAGPVTPSVTESAILRPEQRGRGEGAQKALISRGAGWVAAAILAGAVVALSAVLATASPATVLLPGAARSFRVVPAVGRTAIVSLAPGAPLPASWVQVPAGASVRTSWVQVSANTPPRGIQVVLPANGRPGGVMVQVPATVLPAGENVHARPGRWVEVPARVWVQVPAGVVSPAPTASPSKSAH